jgi:hypothetical protein
MNSERNLQVTLPQKHDECSSCIFANRATEKAKTYYGDHLETLTIGCEHSGGEGSWQVSPGKWVKFESRIMTLTPTGPGLIPDGEEEHLSGMIPVCPHYPIPDIEQKYPDAPFIEVVQKDRWGRVSFYDLPTAVDEPTQI